MLARPGFHAVLGENGLLERALFFVSFKDRVGGDQALDTTNVARAEPVARNDAHFIANDRQSEVT